MAMAARFIRDASANCFFKPPICSLNASQAVPLGKKVDKVVMISVACVRWIWEYRVAHIVWKAWFGSLIINRSVEIQIHGKNPLHAMLCWVEDNPIYPITSHSTFCFALDRDGNECEWQD